MWLDNLKELKKKTGMSSKQIAEKTCLPERTVSRIFSGDTENPYMDTLHRIVGVMGGSLDDLFAECKTILADKDLLTVQTEVERLTGEVARLSEANASLTDSVVKLTAENDLLRRELKYKEEIVALQEKNITLQNSYLDYILNNREKSPRDQ